MASVRMFQAASIVEGSVRKRGYRIECGNCGESFAVPFSLKGHAVEDKEKTARLIRRKFEGNGWQIGKDHRGDRCIRCVVAAANNEPVPPNPHVTKPTCESIIVKESPAMTVNAHPAPPKAGLPREMSWKDSVLIAGKLNEVYIDKDKGYDEGWTDAKVAEDVGVPRDWVRNVRIEVYGEGAAGNGEIEEALGEARKLVADSKPVLKAIDALADSAKSIVAQRNDLADRCARIERRLDAIERSLR